MPTAAVDLEAIERLCDKYLAAGVSGIVALGTTGEATVARRRREAGCRSTTITRVCAARGQPASSSAPVRTTPRTRSTRPRRSRACPAVVGALVVVPYYVRPSERGIVAHFKAVAAKSPVPVIVVQHPARARAAASAPRRCSSSPRTPNIAGVKQAVATLDADTLELLAKAPAGFSVLGGEDTLLFPLMCMGAAGTISAAAHLCTERFVAMIECGLAGKIEDGRAHAEALLPVIRAAYAEPNPRSSRACCTRRAGSPRPTCACR